MFAYNRRSKKFVFSIIFMLFTMITMVLCGCGMVHRTYSDVENEIRIINYLEDGYGGSFSIVSMVDNNKYGDKRIVVHDNENNFDFTCFTWYIHRGLTPFDGKTEWTLDENYQAAKKYNELVLIYPNARLIESDDLLYSHNAYSRRSLNTSSPYQMRYSIVLTANNEKELEKAFGQLIALNMDGATNLFLEYTVDGCDAYPPIRYTRYEVKVEEQDYYYNLNYFDSNEFGSDERYTDIDFINYDIEKFIELYTGERELYYYFEEVE